MERKTYLGTLLAALLAGGSAQALPVKVSDSAPSGNGGIFGQISQYTSAPKLNKKKNAIRMVQKALVVNGPQTALGYGQRMEFRRVPVAAPVGGEANVATCAGTMDLEVLAIEQTYGANGIPVPARLNAQFDQNSQTPLKAGLDLAAGDHETMSIPSGAGEMTLWGMMAFPSFNDPVIHKEIPNSHPTNSMILVNGDNYVQLAALKGVQDPYGSQQSVAQILGPEIMDENGNITLPPNQVIELFELGTDDVNSPAYDMQDLVVRLTSNCNVPQEVVLRDSIGTSSASTDGNYSFSSWQSTTSGSNVKVTMEFTAPQDMTLTSVRTIVAKTTQLLDFNGIDYAIRIWSNASVALANPTVGDVANIIFDSPSAGPSEWGVTTNMPLIGVVPSYELTFDISSQNIFVPSGESRLIGIHFITDGCSSGAGCLGVLESSEQGTSEKQMGPSMPGGWRWLSDSQYAHYNGRAAWDIRGIAN